MIWILYLVFCSMFCRYTEFGGAVPRRPAEDMAFSVARFVQNGGSFVNYYMVGWSLHLWFIYWQMSINVSYLMYYTYPCRGNSDLSLKCIIFGSSTMEELTLIGHPVASSLPPAMTMTVLLMNTVCRVYKVKFVNMLGKMTAYTFKSLKTSRIFFSYLNYLVLVMLEGGWGKINHIMF